jgi:hypothetical protein
VNKNPKENAPAFSLNTFAGYAHCHAWDGSELSYCLASRPVWTVPLAAAQERTDELPCAVVAMNAIAAMEGHRELTIPPTFVNVVGNCPRHASQTSQTSENVRKGTSKLDACNLRK